MGAAEFEDANAACSLLPGPTSTQLAILCALRLAGPAGALVGGAAFILPAVLLVLGLAALFLADQAPGVLRGAAAGAGAAVAAVALRTGWSLAEPSVARARARSDVVFWALCAAAGAALAAIAPAAVVLGLIACGAAGIAHHRGLGVAPAVGLPGLAGSGAHTLGPLAWTALKVGGLTWGGGFVIVPLMQGDAVHVHHWMSSGAFLTAVALGQITPGPVVATVAAVGYAARGVAGALLAAAVAFTPSFAFVLALGGGRRFERLRRSPTARGFLHGAGPAAIGAILGSAIPLARGLGVWWQWPLLAGAAVALLALRRSIVGVLLCAGGVGALAVALGAPAR